MRIKRRKPRVTYLYEDTSEEAVESPQLTFRINGELHQIDTWSLTGFSKTLREQALERDHYACYICGSTGWLQVHHIVPRRIGGKHTLDNLITLCSGCHSSVEAGDTANAVKQCVRRAMNETDRRIARPDSE